MSEWREDPDDPTMLVREHPRRGPERAPKAPEAMRAAARSLLERLPVDLHLPLAQDEWEHFDMPSDLGGCSREELHALSEVGAMPYR